jgi:DNA-binding IclR family transcriptional regulator
LDINDESIVKSLYKSLRILECFTTEKPELGITEISEALHLYKSNVHSILSTFEKAGYIEKNHENSKYRLGMKILELSHVINANNDFIKKLLPYMQKISNITNENVYLAIYKGAEVLYLDACCPLGNNPTRSMQGEKAPLYCTGIGKAILAFLPENNVNMVLNAGLKRFTENTITDGGLLNKELERIRERGYSTDNMEHEYGIKCVAVPVRGKNGSVICAISVSGPSLRFPESEIESIANILKENLAPIQYVF